MEKGRDTFAQKAEASQDQKGHHHQNKRIFDRTLPIVLGPKGHALSPPCLDHTDPQF